MHVGANVATGLLLAAALCAGAPKKGPDLAVRTDGVEPLNEPCYVHDAACVGYPVCCVTKGTCINHHSGTISSNTAYYEGGCQSKESSKKDWANTACVQQGECLAQRLEVCKGGKTKPTFMTAVPAAVQDRLMANSCESECASSYYGHSGGNNDDDDSNITSTGTTTTTILTRVTKSYGFFISDVTAVQSAADVELQLKSAIAALAGFGVDHSMVTVENFNAKTAGEQSVSVHLDVSTAHSITHEEVKTALDGTTDSQVNAALAMRIGTCSYTMTIVPMTSTITTATTDPMATTTMTITTATTTERAQNRAEVGGAEATGANGALQLLSATMVLWPLWSHGP